jgi:nitrile hydratase
VLLGIPPDWYKSRAYRSRMVREPRKVLAEFGLKLSKKISVRVHDSSADMRYLVLPMRPAGTEGWSEKRLAALVNRNSMIGVAVPETPQKKPRSARPRAR